MNHLFIYPSPDDPCSGGKTFTRGAKKSFWFHIFWDDNMFDGFVKSPLSPVFVIPAKAGIHPAEGGTAFAGVTAFLTFYEIIKLHSFLFLYSGIR
jgi:hypothetical protein